MLGRDAERDGLSAVRAFFGALFGVGEQEELVDEEAGGFLDRLGGGYGAVGPDLQDQTLEVGALSDAGALDGVVDLSRGREDRIDGKDPDGLAFALWGLAVALVALDV